MDPCRSPRQQCFNGDGLRGIQGRASGRGVSPREVTSALFSICFGRGSIFGRFRLLLTADRDARDA